VTENISEGNISDVADENETHISNPVIKQK
jgi:hypothetical protein